MDAKIIVWARNGVGATAVRYGDTLYAHPQYNGVLTKHRHGGHAIAIALERLGPAEKRAIIVRLIGTLPRYVKLIPVDKP
jgi:hypothetical protein